MSKPTLLSVMGDYTDPEILAMVARCSKGAHDKIKLLLYTKLSNAEEMRKMALRFYPSLKELQKGEEAVHYRLFAQHPLNYTLEIEPMKGFILATLRGEYRKYSVVYIYPAMRTAEGRRCLIEAIRFWEEHDSNFAVRAKELRETIGRDMGLRFVIRRNREAFCQHRFRNTPGDDSGALVPHLLPLPRDGAP
jgi:hypothetical protein